ncbi:hypothetical protein EW146_g7134 [Bondarzewia mesenterica]|uniref:Ubiquitin carboxyl-terminal hydrolase n=1 Tax=Bondarzewia mesenterica TaxID=1095465 RepID=A0A4S4LSA5_9AGAM|nr:hypothetical protein EW146_g7134 [Bondarzewia mesenterica]
MPISMIDLECGRQWANKVGLVPTDQFGDVYGLDDEVGHFVLWSCTPKMNEGQLLSMVPRPVKAVVLLFPIGGSLEAARVEEDEKIKREGQVRVDPTIMWIKQTIGNACGTMGLLHALANSNVTIEPESALAKFIDECKGRLYHDYQLQTPQETPLFADAHREFASTGQTAVPDSDADVDLHFTCFVQAPSASARENETEPMEMRLIELDGRRNGPIDRGVCTDFLRDVAKYVKEQMIPKASSAQFSMMALATGF